MLTAYFLILLALLFSAFFSGSEIAFISANRLKIEVKTQQGNLSGRILSKFYEQPSQFLGTMLVGNNIALVIFGILTEELWKEPLQAILPIWLSGDFSVLLILTLITTVIVLLGGEFIPKSLFQMFAEKVLVWTAYFLGAIYWLLTPIVWITVWLSKWLLKIFFKTEIKEDSYSFSRVDLEDLVIEVSSKVESEEDIDFDTDLFQQALLLRDITVEGCLIPMNEVEWVHFDVNLETLKQKFIQTKFSRLLVLDKTQSTFIGYIHHQNIFKKFEQINEVISDITSVDIDDDGYEVLNEFIKNKKSIAYVIDGDKKLVGMITLEDILERIFGNIDDEHDD
ncbi:MAG: CBS domain containing-hemolysin-like protein [Saprospiraceae bacterium]|jgi:putative hemolysin